MTSMILIRAVAAIATAFFVLSAVFFVVRLSGDPTNLLLPLDYTPEQKEALEQRLGVDKPLIQQYLIFLGDVAQGDMGDSHRWHTPALEMVLERLPASASLAVVAFAMSMALSIPLGALAAAKRGTALDSIIGGATGVGLALPNFVLGVLLVWLISVEAGWLPVGGTGGVSHYILPAITLAAYPMASQARIVRSAVADTLSQDYIRTARAKGLSPGTVLWRHALRGSMIPVLTILGIQWQFFVGGSVVVETVFAWPGVGRLMADAVASRDFAVVQSGVVVLTIVVVITNLITDISYVVVDPRYRAGS